MLSPTLDSAATVARAAASPKAAPACAGEAMRLEALRHTGLLDSPSEECFDRISRLAMRCLRVPVALVSLVDDHRQFFKSAVGLPEPWASARETPLSHSFCQHVVGQERPLVVSDARLDERVKTNLAIPDLGVVAYLGIPIRLRSGAVIGSFCAIDGEPRAWTDEDLNTMADLTASVVAEIELRATLRSQAEVMAIVSHDLKNPIAAVLLSAELLTRKIEGGQVKAPSDLLPQVKRLRNLGIRMEALVREVLDQARADYEPIILKRQELRAAQLVQTAADSVANQAAEKGVKILLAAELAELTIYADQERLLQVIGNLVGNAVEYTPAGGEVKIFAEEGESSLRILVADEGPGVPVELREKIFEKFWRPAGSASGGHGLGLYIARTLVEAHGGTLRMVDLPNVKGACMVVEIPTRLVH